MFISKEAAMIFKLSDNICEFVKSFTNYKKIYFSVYILSNSKNKFTKDEKRSRFSLSTTSIYNVRGQQLE